MISRIALAVVCFAAGCGGCDEEGATVDASDMKPDDAPVDAMKTGFSKIFYVKASNTQTRDLFGSAVAISGDGNTLAIAATGEASLATGIDGDQSSNSANEAGAVYVFVRVTTISLPGVESWMQQAYLKASNSNALYNFGSSLALSYDGSTLVVGSAGEQGASTGINANQAACCLTNAGAAYVFTRNVTTWTQQAYLKASNTDMYDRFGQSVALSADGNTLAVGASWESSNAVGVDGNQTDDSAVNSGAVYVFGRAGTTWSQQAYVKASNTGNGDYFGAAVALAADGKTLAVGAFGEASGVADSQTDNSAMFAGAVYVFDRSGASWTQQAYLKAPYPSAEDYFGLSISLSGDGSTLAAGALFEDSAAQGIGGDAQDETAKDSGAAYVYRRSGAAWSAPVYIKASSSDASDLFGTDVALNAAGNRLLVTARGESGASTGFGGDPTSNDAESAGAAYLLAYDAGNWNETYYLKASNAEALDGFGARAAIAADGGTLAISSTAERSSAKGVDGDQTLNDAEFSGATYVFQ